MGRKNGLRGGERKLKICVKVCYIHTVDEFVGEVSQTGVQV